MNRSFVWFVTALGAIARRIPSLADVRRHQGGQATAEYALVLLGAAAVALLFTAWAAKSGAIGKLFDTVVDQLIDKAG